MWGDIILTDLVAFHIHMHEAVRQHPLTFFMHMITHYTDWGVTVCADGGICVVVIIGEGCCACGDGDKACNQQS
ncbi:MAG: hypothetical protein DHS20C08_23430 [Rhodomicrobium sp.]|nr:MAG: hypothetical protein DHS20C08_23430 [Rhodomicrobium sp.]